MTVSYYPYREVAISAVTKKRWELLFEFRFSGLWALLERYSGASLNRLFPETLLGRKKTSDGVSAGIGGEARKRRLRSS